MIKDYTQFFKNIMFYLGIYGWTIEFTGDNYCWKSRKTITVDLEYNGDVRQIILHEIAHILTARFCNQKHNPQFWKHLEFLTTKFLGRLLDNNQIRHKKFMTNGYYSLCYT